MQTKPQSLSWKTGHVRRLHPVHVLALQFGCMIPSTETTEGVLVLGHVQDQHRQKARAQGLTSDIRRHPHIRGLLQQIPRECRAIV